MKVVKTLDRDKFLFPFDEIREGQLELMNSVYATVSSGGNLLAHAPTGLGKTIGVLAPSLAKAVEKGYQVWFLTSKNSQHTIALETIAAIEKNLGKKLKAVDLVGKSHLCINGYKSNSVGRSFHDWCDNLKADQLCRPFLNTNKKYGKPMNIRKIVMDVQEANAPFTELKRICAKADMCPYEIAVKAIKKANLVICDYYYLFSEKIRDTLLQKADLTLDRIIMVIDEAHNLPTRVRSLMSITLSESTIRRAVKYLYRLGIRDAKLTELLFIVKDGFDALGKELVVNEEKLVGLDELRPFLPSKKRLSLWIKTLEEISLNIFDTSESSALKKFVEFIDEINKPHESYMYSMSRSEDNLHLVRRCLDPSLVTAPLFKSLHACIAMSATFLPIAMYRDILGFENPKELILTSPFPVKNQLTLVVNDVTTTYTKRTNDMYVKYADCVTDIVNSLPGNSLIFFASYAVRDEILKLCKFNKTLFIEPSGASPIEKEELLTMYKETAKKGYCALAASFLGSYGEGIDLPGKLVECVILVGLPLQKPTLETEALIRYYGRRFKRGWDYGYIFPAMNKALQAAGRCIRSPTDRGVVALLDSRYLYEQYQRCLPSRWELIKTVNPKVEVEKFFKKVT